ncbi:MAG: HPr family phosphocarrier protein [Clostridia bacterium]
MIKKEITVTNKTGLHARPASQFVKQASSYSSNIILHCKGREINAKSIIGVLAAGINMGTIVGISAEGPDEQQAVDSLIALIESNFGE